MKLAKEVYYQLPKAIRQRGFMGVLCGLVHKKLLVGKSRETVITEVLTHYSVEQVVTQRPEVKPGSILASFIVRDIQVSPQQTHRTITATPPSYKEHIPVLDFVPLPDG